MLAEEPEVKRMKTSRRGKVIFFHLDNSPLPLHPTTPTRHRRPPPPPPGRPLPPLLSQISSTSPRGYRSEHGFRGGGGRRRRAGAHGAKPPRPGHPQVGLRRRQGRRRQDHLQLHPLRPPRLRPPVRARHLHRPRAQPQRRLPAALHQIPHPRPRIHQPLRHGKHQKHARISSVFTPRLTVSNSLFAGL